MTDPLLDKRDFRKFQAKDEAWFLGAAGETVRDYCGWHIAPIVSDTDVECRVGAAGIIMLPTLNLVSVEQVLWGATVLPANMYRARRAGYIELVGFLGPGRPLPSMYPTHKSTVQVDFTHGYETLPKTVAEVGYELTGRTLEKPAGVVTDMMRGPTRYKFNEFGAVLSEDQKARLAPYTLTRV